MRITALLALALMLPGALLAQEPAAPPPVEVTYLANEGFLIRAGEQAVLIDAFVAEPYSLYRALTPEMRRQLEAAEGPFAGVDLALTSHHHRDHWQVEPARRFLDAAPGCSFASSAQVVGELGADGWERAGDDGAPPHPVRLAPGETEVLERDGLGVELLHLSHGTGRHAKVQNLGHLITIAGRRLLHVGDAAVEEANFAPYRLAERDLDLAFVPFWYFLSPEGQQLVRRHFAGARLVACHVPDADRDEVAALLAKDWPEAVLLRDPGDTLTLPPPDGGDEATADEQTGTGAPVDGR